jgi:predicted ester cyclase
MERLEMLRLVEEHYRTFWQGDLDDFDNQLAPDFIDQDTSADRHGIQPAKEYALTVRGAFPDMTVTVEQAIAESDWIAVRALWEGTNTGQAFGRQATNRRVKFAGMVFWRFDSNGLIAERWSQIDLGSMFAQLEMS